MRRNIRSNAGLGGRPGAGVLSLAGGGLALAIAPAAEAQTPPASWQFEVGAFLSYHFGGRDPARLAFSVEARELHAKRWFACREGAAGSFGMVQRVALVGWDQVRLTVGTRAGMDRPEAGTGAEVAAGYRIGREPGPLLHLGVEAAVANVAFARLAYVPRVDTAVGIGAGFPHSMVGVSCDIGVPGRPLRRGAQRAPLPATRFAGDGLCVDSNSSQRLAAVVWAARAAAEWASVPAFLELAGQLSASGAPRALVARAYAAAVEESRHAVLSAAIAAALGGAGVEIAPPVLAPRPTATGQAGLERLAIESYRDGCIGEEAAAAWAGAEAEVARSPFVRMAQRSIAADEAGHAALAWDVVAWTLATGGAGVRSALVDAADEGQPGVSSAPGDDAARDDLTEFGCLPAASRRRIHRQRAEAARRQLNAVI